MASPFVGLGRFQMSIRLRYEQCTTTALDDSCRCMHTQWSHSGMDGIHHTNGVDGHFKEEQRVLLRIVATEEQQVGRTAFRYEKNFRRSSTIRGSQFCSCTHDESVTWPRYPRLRICLQSLSIDFNYE